MLKHCHHFIKQPVDCWCFVFLHTYKFSSLNNNSYTSTQLFFVKFSFCVGKFCKNVGKEKFIGSRLFVKIHNEFLETNNQIFSCIFIFSAYKNIENMQYYFCMQTFVCVSASLYRHFAGLLLATVIFIPV
jgi:hypothetical protein